CLQTPNIEKAFDPFAPFALRRGLKPVWWQSGHEPAGKTGVHRSKLIHLCRGRYRSIALNVTIRRLKGSKTMRRREFITLIGGAVAAGPPLTAFGKPQRIAIVVPAAPVTFMSETSDDPGGFFPAIFKELRLSGYVEGQNLVVDRYSGEGRATHFP